MLGGVLENNTRMVDFQPPGSFPPPLKNFCVRLCTNYKLDRTVTHYGNPAAKRIALPHHRSWALPSVWARSTQPFIPSEDR
ncbi:hypothetical protein TNCV_2245351 [Trichonephila clavipes]|nr:hypothetical protein TNCV_2245351 [Trichonephila clavipes]